MIFNLFIQWNSLCLQLLKVCLASKDFDKIFINYYYNYVVYSFMVLETFSQFEKYCSSFLRMRSMLHYCNLPRPYIMDLSSSIEQQQGVNSQLFENPLPRLQKEQHSLPSLPKKEKKNVFGAIINAFTAFIAFLAMIGALLTLSIFIIVQNAVDTGNSTGCIIFSSYNPRDTPAFQFGDFTICNYVIWSMVAVSVICLLHIFRSCCQVICSLVVDFPT